MHQIFDKNLKPTSVFSSSSSSLSSHLMSLNAVVTTLTRPLLGMWLYGFHLFGYACDFGIVNIFVNMSNTLLCCHNAGVPVVSLLLHQKCASSAGPSCCSLFAFLLQVEHNTQQRVLNSGTEREVGTHNYIRRVGEKWCWRRSVKRGKIKLICSIDRAKIKLFGTWMTHIRHTFDCYFYVMWPGPATANELRTIMVLGWCMAFVVYRLCDGDVMLGALCENNTTTRKGTETSAWEGRDNDIKSTIKALLLNKSRR